MRSLFKFISFNSEMYLKLSLAYEDSEMVVKNWETYSGRQPNSYWVTNYSHDEPSLVDIDQSLWFPLHSRFGELRYLAVWIDPINGIIMSEPVRDEPASVEIVNGMQYVSIRLTNE